MESLLIVASRIPTKYKVEFRTLKCLLLIEQCSGPSSHVTKPRNSYVRNERELPTLVMERNVIESIMRSYIVQFSAARTVTNRSKKSKKLHRIKIN